MSQRIRKVEIKGKKIFLEIMQQGQPKGLQSVVKKTRKELTNQIPHADLLKAVERLTPHLQIVPGFTDNHDDNGNFLASSQFTDLWWKDDERYADLELTGIHVATKADETAIYLIGKKTNESGGVTDIKTPIINFIKTETDKDYRFSDVAKKDFETLWFEVEEFIKGKTGDTQLQASFPDPEPAKSKVKAELASV